MIKIIKHYYADKTAYEWVRGLADWKSMASGTYDLFISMLTRSAWRYKANSNKGDLSPAYPLHNRWLRKIKANPKEIPEHLIGCDNTWVKASQGQPGKCRYYWINNDVVRAFEDIVFAKKTKHCINLYDGKKARADRPLPNDIQKPSLYDKSRHLVTSQLVAESIKVVSQQKVPINVELFDKYVQRLNLWFNKRCHHRIDNPTLKGRLVKNTRSANFLSSHLQKFRSPISGKISYYEPCYRALYTGRITEQFIGLQSCSKVIRRKLLTGMGCIDMDLQNAQLSCLHYLLPPGEVKNSLAKKMARIYTEASSFGLPKKLVKPFLYAYIFNAGRLNYRISSVITLKQHCIKHGLLSNFNDFLAGLAPIKLATQALLSLSKEKLNQGCYINHAGVKLTTDKLQKLAESKLYKYLRKNKTTMLCFPRQDYLDHAKDKILLSFFIQGIETYVIHTLTVKSLESDYTVIANQHDGIIIVGNKNSVGEQMAKINSDMNSNFVLVEKPL